MAKRSDVPRIAVIGAGRMARDFHLPSQKHLEQLGRSRLVALCDRNEDLAAKVARKFRIPAAYRDVDEMLDQEKPDGVLVLVPVPATPLVASHVLRRGCKLMMEKPPGGTVKECRRIIAASQASKTKHMVAFNRRFCPVLVQGRQEALKRGAIKGANGLMYRNRRAEFDFISGTGIHSLDALRFLGGDIDRVETEARVLEKSERRAFSIFISYRNGGFGTLNVRPQAGVQLERYEVFSPHTMVSIHAGVGWLVDTPGSCQVYEDNQPRKISNVPAPYLRFKGALKEAMAGGFFGENEAFIAALRGEGPFGPSVEESLQSVEICEAIQNGRSWKRRG